jgi:uncharacterized membrane protein
MTLTEPTSTTPTWTPTWRTRGAFWWLLLSALAVAVFAPLQYAFSSLADVAANDSPLAANYVDQPAAVRLAFYLHIGFGGLALLLSPFQFMTRLRTRLPHVHRAVGRIAVGSIAIAGLAGLVLAPHSLAGPVGTVGFGLLAVLWLAFAATAFRAIRQGDVPAHRRWMIRAFALTYAAVTLRLWLGVLILVQTTAGGVDGDVAFDRAYLIVPFLSWVPNLLVAEWYLRTRRPDTAPATLTARRAAAG